MKNMELYFRFNLQMFDDPAPEPEPDPEPTPPEGTTLAADIAPEISVDHVTRLTTNLAKLFEIIGVTKTKPMASGSLVKVYKWQTSLETSPEEGLEIPLSKAERVLAATYEIELKKYRANVTAEAIQSRGRARAINEKDAELVKAVQKAIKGSLFTSLNAAEGEADQGATLQEALANAWGACTTYYEDYDVTPVFFVNPMDVAAYLGSANITVQTAFGFSYIENFMGLGTAIIVSGITRNTVIATAAENLNYAYIPANGGDLASAFGLTSDQTGYVGITHHVVPGNATIDTLLMCGGILYAEDASGLFKAEIDAA